MKKYIALICAILMLLLTACNNQMPPAETPTETYAQSEQPTDNGEIMPQPEEKISINTMEKLTDVDGVISVTEQSFSKQINGAVAYKVLYESENGKLAADVVLPEDYTNEDKKYAVLIYFPQVGTSFDSLALNYALNGIIVIRPYARGYGESEGMRDLGGKKDLADSQKLLEIFDSASFIENSKIFVAGSSEGSVNALRLFAEDTEKRISGCAVVDVIADLPAFGKFRGEGVQNLFAYLIGKTYEEAPEEYDLRSAVKFSEKLDRPILLLHFLQSPIMSVEQTDVLYDLIKDTNKDCLYHKIDALSGDFEGESLQRLLSWINKYNESIEGSIATTPEVDETGSTQVEQTDSDYIIHTDWMKFCFSKRDFKESDVADVVTEAESVMADIRNHLKLNYTLAEATGTVCYFNSSYRNEDGQARSECFWNERIMYCVSPNDFVHEYVHMIGENNADLVYHPSKLFSEGLAQYVSLNFYDGIATRQYNFFKEATVSKSSNASEHQMILRLLSNRDIAYNAENYNKAFLAMLCKYYDVSKLDKNSDFYKYYVGQVFVDYCVDQLGGIETFLAVYCDSVTIADIYGIDINEIVSDACAYNTSLFYD